MKTSENLIGQSWGIVGGGQLARMLALRAHCVGVKTWILSANEDDPAVQVCRNWIKGPINSVEACRELFKKTSNITFESEFCDISVMREASRGLDTHFFPRLDILDLIQDRLSQKELLIKNGLPTSPFKNIARAEDIFEVQKDLGAKIVVKKRRFGYDGYGTYIFKTAITSSNVNDFLQKDFGPSIAEAFVNFKRELALIVARNKQGDVQFLPLVETFQKDSRCFWVKGPVTHKKLKDLQKKLTKFLNTIDYIGVLAVELFDTGKDLMINELAPRVHNSGHYSIDALVNDQFLMHLRAGLGLHLPKFDLVSTGFAMVNLLGSSANAAKVAPGDNVHLHWYGKNENRPGRKMGHLTALAASPQVALKNALKNLKGQQL